MKDLLLSLHVLFAIFAVGPLVGTASTAARGIRAGDPAAVAGSARTVRIYAYASIVVALLGLGLVQPKWHNKFSYPWVWISLLLYLVALALALVVLEPALRAAARELGSAGGASSSAAARVAGSGGLIALLFAVVVFLMVYQPH